MISKSQLKYIQSLGQKKYRDEDGVFIAEGPKIIKELLQSSHAKFISLHALDDWIKKNENLLRGIDISVIEDSELEKVSQLKTPNQVIAVVKKFELAEPLTKNKISLVLDTIQDPGNLGTIIRIADWFAIPHVICSQDCADLYNPKVVQATMGSIARVKVFYADLPEWLERQKEIRIYATMLEGKDVTKMNSLAEGLIIIGNESRGISDKLLPFVNEKITIPKRTSLKDSSDNNWGRQGSAESLNAAVATGIILSNLA